MNTTEVQKIANLIKIKLSDQDTLSLSEQLETALHPMKVLEELNTDEVKPTSQTINTNNVFREDKSESGLTQQEALQNAHETQNGYLVVQKVIK